MKIVVTLQDSFDVENAHLFFSRDNNLTPEENEKLDKAIETIFGFLNVTETGFRCSCTSPIVSVKRNDNKRFIIEINEEISKIEIV